MPLPRPSARRSVLCTSVSLTALGLSLLALPATAQEAAPLDAPVQDSTAAVAATPQAAQDGASASPVFVLGDITLTVDDVAGYVAQGAQTTKSATPIAEAQQSISVVTADQIADQGAADLGESLAYSTGVNSQPFGGDPRFDNPTLRGFSAERAQYVNGLRQGRFFGGGSYEIYGMQQVEVLRGPSSALYGSGSPAGIVNQVQKRAGSTPFGEVGLGYGTNGYAKAFFDVNSVATDTLSYRVTGIGSDITRQVEETGNRRGYLAGAARWQPDDATTVDLLASYTKDSPDSPVGVPFDLTGTDDKALRDRFLGRRGWNDSDREMWNLGVEVSHDLESGWRISQGFRYESFDWQYDGSFVRAALDADGNILQGISRQDENSDTISLDTRLEGEVTTGAVVHQLLFGVDLRRYETEENSLFSVTDAPVSPDDLSYVNGPPTFAGASPSVTDATFTQIGIYAQDEIILDAWRGSLALRYDRAEQTGLQYGTAADYDEDALTGRIGLARVLANGITPYVSYATGFEPQTGLTEDLRPRKPLESTQLELGVKFAPTVFDGLLTAAIYDLRQDNVGQYQGFDADRNAYLYRDIGQVKSRGLELEATARIAEAWSLKAAYAYNDTEQQGGSNQGQPMPNAPRHLASLWLTHDFGNGISAGGGIRHIGEREDAANARTLDDVTLADLRVGFERDAIAASISIQNLTDEVYLSTCGFYGCFYGEGREVMAEIAYKW
ncbi:TonB-dependent siderophore receptor [Paracoccus nototheniae]|uniref:TonB-dependent siderophore receptor n=2 Tax=Paracoccus nototheniae TaxID=2489002 RepID=A0ABW4DTN5_9RHOB